MRPVLFRPESIAARQNAWLGQPTISLAPPVSLISISSCVLAAVMVAMVILGSYARRTNLRGLMLPSSGLVKVFAPQRGAIRSTNVANDQKVHAGEILYVLDTDTTSSGGATQERILVSLRHQRDLLVRQIETRLQLRMSKDRELQDKITNLRAQIEQAALQIAVQSSFTDVLQRQYSDFSSYVTKGLTSVNDLQVREQAWMHAKTGLEDLKNTKLKLEAQLTDAEYQLRTNAPQTDADINPVHNQVLDIDQRIANSEASRSVQIRAPSDGYVTAIDGHVGQSVAANAPLLTIVPTSPLLAELVAPSSAVGFIAPGERVLLRYDAFPYQHFGQYLGTVVDVSRAALTDEEIKSLPIAAQKVTYYRVDVRPDDPYVNVDGREQPLRASMQVEAYVLLDRRRLYQWILAPVYGLRRSL
jgi:membrane fusion protein